MRAGFGVETTVGVGFDLGAARGAVRLLLPASVSPAGVARRATADPTDRRALHAQDETQLRPRVREHSTPAPAAAGTSSRPSASAPVTIAPTATLLANATPANRRRGPERRRTEAWLGHGRLLGVERVAQPPHDVAVRPHLLERGEHVGRRCERGTGRSRKLVVDECKLGAESFHAPCCRPLVRQPEDVPPRARAAVEPDQIGQRVPVRDPVPPLDLVAAPGRSRRRSGRRRGAARTAASTSPAGARRTRSRARAARRASRPARRRWFDVAVDRAQPRGERRPPHAGHRLRLAAERRPGCRARRGARRSRGSTGRRCSTAGSAGSPVTSSNVAFGRQPVGDAAARCTAGRRGRARARGRSRRGRRCG